MKQQAKNGINNSDTKIKNDNINDKNNTMNTTQINEKYRKIEKAIELFPFCESLLISLYALYLQKTPPIFVDIPISIKSDIKLSKTQIMSSAISIKHKNQCMNLFNKISYIEHLEYSAFKSTKANTHIFW